MSEWLECKVLGEEWLVMRLLRNEKPSNVIEGFAGTGQI